MADENVTEVHHHHEGSNGGGNMLLVILVIVVILILGFLAFRAGLFSGTQEDNNQIDIEVPVPNGGDNPSPDGGTQY